MPRLYTPELRPLVPDVVDSFGVVTQEATTWGYSVIDFAENILEIELFPWQRWLLIHLLELDGTGALRFQTAVVLIARQNGKSTLSQVLALWFMVVRKWPLVLGTAQDLTTAEEVWDGGVEILRNDDELAPLIERVIQVNGKKALVLAGRIRWMVKAANRKAGRGLSGNLILMDELREQQNWAAWGAITKTTQAQDDLLILCLSNAGDVASVVLRHLRTQAHIALGDPDGIAGDELLEMTAPSALEADDDFDDEFEDDEDLVPDGATIFLAEWSATPGVAVKDRNGWAQANPSLGHRIRIRKISDDSKTDPEWVFRTEVLCQWPDSVLDGPFPAGSWEKGRNKPLVGEDGSVRIAHEHELVGDLVAGIDHSIDRSMTWIAVGGRNRQGKWQIELWAARSGTDWVKRWLRDEEWRKDHPSVTGKITAVTGQTSKGAPPAGLVLDLLAASENRYDAFRLGVDKLEGGDIMLMSAALFDAVRDVEVMHNPQPPLDLAAGTATMKILGDGFVLDRRNSLADVAPLMAFGCALWMLQKAAPTRSHAALPPEALDDGPGDQGALTAGLMDDSDMTW